MKRLALLTIPAIAALAIGSSTAISALAAVYPESDDDFIRPLTFSSLTDYSIEDELFAFADGNSVKLYEDGKYGEYPFKAKVAAVDIAVEKVDKTEKTVIYCLSGGMTYYYDTESDVFTPFEEGTHNFDGLQTQVTLPGYFYTIDSEGLTVFDSSTKEHITLTGEFFNLKTYGGKAYAICGNTLYSFTGTAKKALDDLEYMIDASDVEIAVGQQAKTELKTFKTYHSDSPDSDYHAQFVTITEGAVMIEIDLESDLESVPDDGHFTSKDIIKAAPNCSALFLCKTGDFAIVSILDKAYAVLSKNTDPSSLTHTGETPYNAAQIQGGNIYASPFMAGGTVTYSRASGITVEVVAKIQFEGVLDRVFYQVRYESAGETIEGFVAEELLKMEVREDNKPSTFVPDPETSEKNDTKKILIIFAVVVLVLAALAYVLHVTTKGKLKGKKKKEKTEDEEK